MLTIFTNPRPFNGRFENIQRNAINSWRRLSGDCEIILFEDEEKTADSVAQELGVKCEKDFNRNEFGTPLFDSVLSTVRKKSKNEIIAQVNADIILLGNFFKSVKAVKNLMGSRPFFMTGRRFNLEVQELIDFNDPDWDKKMAIRAQKQGKLHRLSGMDYWVFPRDFDFKPPSFIVGRPGIDSWLILKARKMKIPVIDATEVITIIHQNHNYPKKSSDNFNIEKERNIKLAGGLSDVGTIADSDWILTSAGLKKPRFPRRILSELSLFGPWRKSLSLKRKLFS